MKLSDFDYPLPEDLIAQYPPAQRGASRLLCLEREGGAMADRQFADLRQLLGPGDLLVFNNTRVLRARLYGVKATGGRVEILVERVLSPDAVLAQIRASKALRPGGELRVGDQRLTVVGREAGFYRLSLPGGDAHALMDAHGHLPLPPYIDRADGDVDEERYQTVYARTPGAVAAPTAGLHFDQTLLQDLDALGVRRVELTLHVGAGTFQPVRHEDLDAHDMHAEWLTVDQTVVDAVAAARSAGGRVIAVGTTSVRALESAAAGGKLLPYTGDTRLFIRPGYRFRAIDAMLTNFHLPKSTLLMLVAAFAGYPEMMAAYRHAVAQRYRFFSYGDAMLIGAGVVPGRC